MSSWRDKAAPIIARVLADYAGRPEADIRRALTWAYPFGLRRGSPYAAWLDEIKRQRKEKAGKERFSNEHGRTDCSD